MKKYVFFLLLPLAACSGNQTDNGDQNSDSLNQTVADEEQVEETAAEINDNLPKGWFKSGDDPESYEMAVDQAVMKSGNNSAYIESKEDHISGFATMMQTSTAKPYLGKRLKLTGYIKTENVKDWAGMWLRIDAKGSDKYLGFDNMQDRSIKGTTDWTKCEIVLDVPMEGYTLNYGVLLSGTGKVWFDDFSFEEVDETIPTTDVPYLTSKSVLETPENVGFEE